MNFKELILWVKAYWFKFRNEVEKHNCSIYSIIKEIEYRYPNCAYEITDLYKRTCDLEKLKVIAHLIPMKFMKYKTEIFDCEDFSIIALGWIKLWFPQLPIGLVFIDRTDGTKHAMLVAIYKVNKHFGLTFIEPQTGEVFYPDGEPYLIII